MNPPTEHMVMSHAGDTGHVAIVYCNAAFRFEPGHRMRAAQCLVCGECIGGEAAAVVGAAALTGEACRCGCIVSDVFLVHAGHLPMAPAGLQAAIRRGLECSAS